MPSGYFRVVRFIPEENLLQLDCDGLSDPNADVVYCEWEYSRHQLSCVVYHGDNKYESRYYLPAVITAISNMVHGNTIN